MLDRKFVGAEVMKKSGSPFKNGKYFSTVLDIVENPYFQGEMAYLMESGEYINVGGAVVILKDNRLLYCGVEFGLDETELKLYRIAGKYALRKNLVDTWEFEPNRTRNTKTRCASKSVLNAALSYQRRVCGEKECLVTWDGVEYLADGVDGDTLLEAKYVENENDEAYCGTAESSLVQENVEKSIRSQFSRVKRIIDKHPDYHSVMVITNSQRAAEYLGQLIGSWVKFKVVG
jgi:hypothetical protein